MAFCDRFHRSGMSASREKRSSSGPDAGHFLGVRRHIDGAAFEAEIGQPVDGQGVGDVLAQGSGIVVLPVRPIELPQIFQALGIFRGDGLPDAVAQRMIIGRREFGVVTGRIDGGHYGE